MIEVTIERQPQLRRMAFCLLPLAIAAVLLIRAMSFGDGPRQQTGGILAIFAIAAAVAALGAAFSLRHETGPAWVLIAAACISTGYAHRAESPSDDMVTVSYLLLLGSIAGGALMLCGFAPERREQIKLSLDLLPPVIALGAASWIFVVAPFVLDPQASISTQIAALLHGIGDIGLLSLGAAGLLSERRRSLQLSSRLLLGAICILAVADVLWLQRLTSSMSTTVRAADVAFGLALGMISVGSLVAMTKIGAGKTALDGIPGDRPIRWGSQVQNAALGGLLVLTGGQSLFGEPVAYGEVAAAGGALAMLVFFVARESVVMHRERHLRQEIGKLTQKIDGLISQVGRDPLTGLLNHRAIHERLDHELAHGRASGQAVAVVLVDVDNFKTVNDTLGHQAGDRVLHAVASILTAACRGSDVAARYAGDEFMLVLPGLNEEHAGAVGARIAEEVRRVDKDLNLGPGIMVSLSIGVAVTHRCLRSMAQTVAIADAAMYDAKEGGKNRVVVVNADTLEITDPIRAEQTVDEIMAATLVSNTWQTPERRQAG